MQNNKRMTNVAELCRLKKKRQAAKAAVTESLHTGEASVFSFLSVLLNDTLCIFSHQV